MITVANYVGIVFGIPYLLPRLDNATCMKLTVGRLSPIKDDNALCSHRS